MHRRALFTGIILILLISMFVMSLPPVSPVQADNLLQGVPSLEGNQIYFSEIGGDASRFDRTESGLSRLAGLVELLGADLYTLEWRTGVPDDADLVILAGPTKDLTTDQTAWLWAYLQNGGHLLLIADPMINPVRALSKTRGLFQLMWDDMGLRGRDDVMVIGGAMHLAVPPADKVRVGTPTPTPAPAVEVPSLIFQLLTTNLNVAHPITAEFEGELAFFGARSIEVDQALREAQVTALVYSAAGYYGETDFNTYVDTGYATYTPEDDTPPGSLVLAAAMEDSGTGARIVLIGDREFATNGGGLQTSPAYSSSFLYPGNIRFLINSITWLLGAEQGAEFAFPTPASTSTPTLIPTLTPMVEGEGS